MKLIKTILVIALAIGSITYEGFVFMKAWEWLLSQIFELRLISLPESIAFLFLVSLFKSGKNENDKYEDPLYQFAYVSLGNIIKSSIVLLAIYLLV